jgi:hypothetical protein
MCDGWSLRERGRDCLGRHAELGLQPHGSVRLTKTISVAQHTTRTYYPTEPPVEVLVNGRASGTSVFDIVAESRVPTS